MTTEEGVVNSHWVLSCHLGLESTAITLTSLTITKLMIAVTSKEAIGLRVTSNSPCKRKDESLVTILALHWSLLTVGLILLVQCSDRSERENAAVEKFV